MNEGDHHASYYSNIRQAAGGICLSQRQHYLRFSYGDVPNRGTRAHQQVQRDYGENDQKEVQLEAEIPYEDLLFVVEGRCDGLIQEDERIMIDEIKSTSGDLGEITEHTYPVHWAQAKMYAYMYAKLHEIPTMAVRLTYFQVPSGERKQFVQEWSFAQLESFVLEVVAAYAPYANLLREHGERRDRSIRELKFPFPLPRGTAEAGRSRV